jgi:hypothetical protein
VKDAGFEYAFTASGTSVKKSQYPHNISRVVVSRHIDLKEFQALLTPLGLTVNRLFTQLLYYKDRVFVGK